jgi:hypothetical protein
VAVIIGILEAADCGSCGANTPGQFSLADTRFRPKIVNLPRNLSVENLLLVFLDELRVLSDVPVIGPLAVSAN